MGGFGFEGGGGGDDAIGFGAEGNLEGDVGFFDGLLAEGLVVAAAGGSEDGVDFCVGREFCS